MSELLVVVLITMLGAFFALTIRHFFQAAWQRGYREGFSVGLQQKIVKVQKTTSER